MGFRGSEPADAWKERDPLDSRCSATGGRAGRQGRQKVAVGIARRGIKEEQRVYRLRHDTGWRINNCITRGGAWRADKHPVTEGIRQPERRRAGNPLSGITRQSGTHQRAYFYNYCRRSLIYLKPTNQSLVPSPSSSGRVSVAASARP